MKARPVEIEIEELVLCGFPTAQRYAIADALEQELTRLVRDGNRASRFEYRGAWVEMDGGTIRLGPRWRGEHTGQQVARAIYATWSDKTRERNCLACFGPVGFPIFAVFRPFSDIR